MLPPPEDEGSAPAQDARARRREALACLRLLIALSRADDATDAAELEALHGLAGELGVSLRPGDLAHDLDVGHLAAWVRTPALRERVLRDLALLARSDGHADPLELALVRLVADRWGLPPPRAPGVDWDLVDVPADLAGRLAERTRGREEALGRAREALQRRPCAPAPASSPDPPLVVQEELEADEALRRCDDPSNAPVLTSVDRTGILFASLPPFTGGALAAASSCGIVCVVAPSLVAVPILLSRLDGKAFMLALGWVVAAAAVIGAWRLAGRRAAQRIGEGVFVPAVMQEAREELVVDDDGGQRIVETGTLIYELAGVVRRASRTATRAAGDRSPGLLVGRREWLLVHPDHPGAPVSLSQLRSAGGEVRFPRGSSREALPADQPERDVTGVRPAGRVTVDVQPTQRCPFCLDGVAGIAPAELMTCAACRVVFHRECLAEAVSCSTVGCRNNRSA